MDSILNIIKKESLSVLSREGFTLSNGSKKPKGMNIIILNKK